VAPAGKRSYIVSRKFYKGKRLASTEKDKEEKERLKAETNLVKGVYETAYYRGIPPSLSEENSGWDYDFGCFLVYDASDGAYMQQAWDSVTSKSMFWDGANIFVMIVRGSASFEPRRRTLAHLLHQGFDDPMEDVASTSTTLTLSMIRFCPSEWAALSTSFRSVALPW